ncbi:baculoviral IAP repeat-containing protein 7-A-like isoform X2 [Saccostrea cucullata]
MPEDIVTFEPLSMFRYFGISTTIMAYPFIHEVNGMMENHFNRLASFKDWPLSAPVSALRLVDSGFYFDVQRSSVACYDCKLHIETRELSSLLGGDTVLNMHLRLSENCSHALQQKKDKEGVGNFVLPFHKPKSEMNSGIFSSNFHGALQMENSNPVPELSNLGISEKNGSNTSTSNIFQPYIGASSENINVQQQDKISNITRDFLFNKDEETYLKYDSGYNSQKGISRPTENVSDARGLPIQTESTDSLSYLTMLGEPHLQPHSMFGGDTIAATAESEEMESAPSPGIPIHDTNEIKKSSTNASLFDSIAAEEEPSYSMRHPDYKTVESRLKTFVFWPFNDKQNKVLLVQCGFFFTGQQDIVRCFACDIGLAEWDETDDPWSEHARHSPHCKYLKKMKGQDFINHVQQEWRKIYNPKTPQMQDFNRRLESFQTEKWPSSITQTPKQIAEAGFYFTGEEDAVRCHYCDGGLREWEPGDDPWTEHARWFPFCKFVMKIKGIQFIDEIQQKYGMGAGNLDSLSQSGSNTAGPGKPSEEDNNPICSQAARSLISMGYSRVKVQHVIDRFVAEKGHNDYTTSNLLDLLLEMEDKGETFPPEPTVQPQSKPTSQGLGNIASFTETSESEQELDPEIIEEENQRLKKQLLCVKCEKSERVIVFTPCGHRLVCKPCSDPMKKCIKCKKKIQKKVKTFLC